MSIVSTDSVWLNYVVFLSGTHTHTMLSHHKEALRGYLRLLSAGFHMLLEKLILPCTQSPSSLRSFGAFVSPPAPFGTKAVSACPDLDQPGLAPFQGLCTKSSVVTVNETVMFSWKPFSNSWKVASPFFFLSLGKILFRSTKPRNLKQDGWTCLVAHKGCLRPHYRN